MPPRTRRILSRPAFLVLEVLQVLAIIGGCVAVVTAWALVMVAIISALT